MNKLPANKAKDHRTAWYLDQLAVDHFPVSEITLCNVIRSA